MRPIRLTMTAFGPYAGREIVDFTVAMDAGIFGIYGDTGAGKTTIFDGISFALFGESSGAERSAEDMISHHAGATALTEVELVFELGEERYVIHRVPLPEGKFDHETADILILLPSGYPDCPPDMFYVSPKVTLAGTGQVPKACKKEHHFAGRVWQRWSRHNNAWRPGVDGLQTMVARVRTALMEARA